MSGAGPSDNENREIPENNGVRRYYPLMKAIFLLVLLILIVFFAIMRYQGLVSAVSAVVSSLRAVFIGGFLAFVLNPIVRLIERGFLKHRKKTGRELTLRFRKRSRALAVALSFVILFACIAGLLGIIIPQVISSVRELIITMDDKIAVVEKGLDWLVNNEASWAQNIGNTLLKAIDAGEAWLEETFGGVNTATIGKITTSVVSAVKWILHVIVGLVIAVYVLMRKETFKAQAKKLVYAAFTPRWANHVMDVLREGFRIFGGFLAGDIIDAIIVGFVSFGVMLILGTPYAALAALIVGVTNLIPFFGPFLGAIPGAILIVLIDPWQALYFLIMIIVIQQVDGNIIKPLVLGDSLGLSPFWIVVSILLFGKILGILGYFLGAPLFALLYYIIKRIAEHFLRKRGLPLSTNEYQTVRRVDPISGRVIYYDPELTADRIRHNDSNRGFGRVQNAIKSVKGKTTGDTSEAQEDQGVNKEEQ